MNVEGIYIAFNLHVDNGKSLMIEEENVLRTSLNKSKYPLTINN